MFCKDKHNRWPCFSRFKLLVQGSEFETGQIAQINLLHYPADNVLMGTEFIWGQREDVNGNTGTDYRVQFSLKVNFDTGDVMRPRY